MKKRLIQSLLLLFALFGTAIGLRVFRATGAEEKSDSGYSSIAVFARALQLIRQDYVMTR